MKVLWQAAKYVTAFFMLVGLVFSSGVFSVLLYGKITGKQWAITAPYRNTIAFAGVPPAVHEPAPAQTEPPAAEPVEATPTPAPRPASAILDAPVFRQHPELPSGCEITSLSMLLHYAGINKTKMDLLPDMKRDHTPLRWGEDGSIVSWGNPNEGFVGDITGKSKAFGIYHGALLELLRIYMPNGVDLTRSSFNMLEEQIAAGIPVVAWTTIDFQVPSTWVTWDTPTGPIETTFMEHAVLLVGYDQENVYVNDPWTGQAKRKINKAQFVKTWEVMGSQAISYQN